MDKETAKYIKENLRIKEICENMHMSLRELSEACGFLRPQQISNIINGRSASMGMIVKISKALGVPIGDLFVRSGIDPTPKEEARGTDEPYRCPTCGQRVSKKKAKEITSWI